MTRASAASGLRLVEPRPAGPRARVLVIRSCRPAQFEATVAEIRRRYPLAEVVALSHVGHEESLRAAGVDRIVEIRGRRFGLPRMRPAAVLRLRRERFDEVVIPQMTAHAPSHGNLYRLALAIGGHRIAVAAADHETVVFERAAFRRHAARQVWPEIVSWLQSPALLLALLVAAAWWPRRAARWFTRRSRPDAGPKGRTRVLHIISTLSVGGAQRQLAELVNRTPASEYDVDILVLGDSDGDFSRRWISRPDVCVTCLAEWPNLVSSVLEVRRHCIAGQYDIVHTWLFMANVIGVAGARLAGASRVVASVRNLSLWKKTWYRQWWFRAADVLSSRAADVVTVNADALAGDHARWAWYPARRIEVVHNGLEPSLFLGDVRDARLRVRQAAGLCDDAVVIGTVGRLAPEKDHLTFLRVIRAVRERGADVHGVIVGDGQLRSQLEAAAAELGLADSVTFLGERDDARRLMAGFDVFVLPSTIEGFPNVLLEAAFLSVPAVASRVGGSPDVLADPRDTFAAGQHEAAARRVIELLDSPSLAAAGAELTRQRAFTLFTADRAARRWFALYDRSSTKETAQ